MSTLQRHWDARAAANFMLGGAGAGLLIFMALADIRAAGAVALALGLVACGLGAVWLEIGRKRRALHVFFNPFTSWMTRESYAALVLFPLAIGSIYVPSAAPLVAAVAAVFLYCQARILRASKGIPAWRTPQIVALMVSAGLAEGAGLALLFNESPLLLSAFALAVVARFVAWRRYRAAAPSAALEAPGNALGWVGTLAAVVLIFVLPPLAGLAALATGWWLKLALVTRAALKQEFSLPHLPVRGTR
jgi:phenylacetyl-CoA:acceptor oxidoreductase subunit 2